MYPQHRIPLMWPSHGTTSDQLKRSNLWWNGPQWLSKNESNWPSMPSIQKAITWNTLDEVDQQEEAVVTMVTSSSVQENIIDITRSSSLKKVINITAYTLRFVNKLQKKQQIETKHLTVDERELAEQLLIKEAQARTFANYKVNKNKKQNIFFSTGYKKG